MIASRFLQPFSTAQGRAEAQMTLIKVEHILSFLRSASDNELTKLSFSVYYLYPDEIRQQLGNHRREGIDYTFIDDYIATYGLSKRFTSKDKSRGSALLQLLRSNPNMTATEFCEIIGLK